MPPALRGRARARSLSLFVLAVALLAGALVPALSITPTLADDSGVLRGTVVNSAGAPSPKARVRVVEARRLATTDDSGAFVFEGLAAGRYHLEASSARFGSGVGVVDVAAGGEATITLQLGLEIHREEIVVSARPDAVRTDDAFQPVDVVSTQELAMRMQPTLGETLEQELGVSSTYFGPGASRPVLRGLGADRSRVLEDGIGVGDVSGLSPDHAVSVDPEGAERVEIVRGPATLMFGGGAIGGVINVLDDRIPESMPEGTLSGRASASYGTNADERGFAASVNARVADGFAIHVGGVKRDADDLEIPGPAERFPEEGEEVEDTGTLENSFVESESFTLGASRIWNRGFVGLSYTNYDTLYGIPGHAHEHGEEEEPEIEVLAEEEGGVSIDLQQRRWDMKGQIDVSGDFLRAVRLRAGYTDYEHVELEGEEIGTQFFAEGLEMRLEALHQQIGSMRGSFGLQYSDTDLEAIGEEAFLEPAETRQIGAFIFEEVERGDWRFLFGGRYEQQDVKGAYQGVARDESFSGLSASVGAARTLGSAWAATATLSRAVRLPSAEELYSFGEHAATRSFEIGDPDLDEETSYGIDLGLRRTEGRLTGELNLFATRIADFIYERAVDPGELETELPVFAYTQDDAEFTGFELHGDFALFEQPGMRIALDVTTEYVRAERREDGEPLPFIPPWSSRVGVHVHAERVWGFVEAQRQEEQDRIFCEAGVDPEVCETSTDGFTFVNAGAGVRFFARGVVHELLVRGRNLTDRLGRNHVSRLKDMAPMPGRHVSLTYRIEF